MRRCPFLCSKRHATLWCMGDEVTEEERAAIDAVV